VTNLGAWQLYLDEPEWLDWYRLPPQLQRRLDTYRTDSDELVALDQASWQQLRQRYVAYATQSVQVYANPYHNADHFRIVEENGMAAVAGYETLTGQMIPLAVKQALAMALHLHDCHHCGSTFRADTRQPLFAPEMGNRLAQEWISAEMAANMARDAGMILPAQLFQIMIIWSSTYGGTTDRGRELGIPDIRPQGFWGRLMRAADVSPPNSLAESLARSIAVNYGEVPATPAARDWQGFLDSQLGFFGYVQHCFDQLDEAAQVPLSTHLGWSQNLARLRQGVVKLGADPTSDLGGHIRQMLAQYGVSLD